MRVLVIPELDDRKEVCSAPSFKMSLALSRGLISIGHYVYFMMPNKESYKQNWVYTDEEINKINESFGDKGEIVFCPMLKDQHQEVLFTPEFLNIVVQTKSKITYDAIVNGTTGCSLMIKKLNASGYGFMDINIPIINYDTDLKVRVNTPNAKTHVLNEATEMTEIFNLPFDYPVFTLPTERDRYFQSAKKYLSPYLLNKARENSSVVYFPIDINRTRNIKIERGDNQTVFFYGGRITAKKKNVEKMIEIYRKIFILKKNVKFVITTPEKSCPAIDIVLGDMKGNIEIHYEQNHVAYLEHLKKADIFMWNSYLISTHPATFSQPPSSFFLDLELANLISASCS